jgi:hypothetical protein
VVVKELSNHQVLNYKEQQVDQKIAFNIKLDEDFCKNFALS